MATKARTPSSSFAKLLNGVGIRNELIIVMIGLVVFLACGFTTLRLIAWYQDSSVSRPYQPPVMLSTHN